MHLGYRGTGVYIRLDSISLPSNPIGARHQGIRQIKKTTLDPVYLFISPPSLQSLRDRLKGRGTETEESMKKRLATALKEIEYAKQPKAHDFVVINDDVDRAYDLLRKIVFGQVAEGDVLPPLDDIEEKVEPSPQVQA